MATKTETQKRPAKGERLKWQKGVVVHTLTLTEEKLVEKKLTKEDLEIHGGSKKTLVIP